MPSPLEPFSHTRGPRSAKIVLVGEAWGEQEEKTGIPFIGQSGQELGRMLSEAGISFSDCLFTNVLNLRPPSNNLESLCVPKAEVPKDYKWSPLGTGKYLPESLLPHVIRLHSELETIRPNLVVALGGTASWALLNNSKISTIRGVTTSALHLPGQKILPTYHPAAVLRQWALRVVVLQDLLKSKRQAQFPELIRPRREVLVNPTFEEIAEWYSRPASIYSVDIETGARMIKCIGFARSRSDSIVIPFVDFSRPGGNFWSTREEECRAWRWVEAFCAKPIPKLFQNGLYDLQYLVRRGIKPVQCTEDTMLLHHSLYPELQKGLGFLGSIYTDEASWKLMVRKRAQEQLKKEE